MRTKIVARQLEDEHTFRPEGVELARQIAADRHQVNPEVKLIVCPPFTHLSGVIDVLKGSDIEVGAQNCAAESAGAYTGEVSAAMIAAQGCRYVILGQRRSAASTTAKPRRPCAGRCSRPWPTVSARSSASERISPNAKPANILRLSKSRSKRCSSRSRPSSSPRSSSPTKPVWAIGTGKTATAEQAQEIPRPHPPTPFVRSSARQPTRPRFLYGGSCKPTNAPRAVRQGGCRRRSDRRSSPQGGRFSGNRRRISEKVRNVTLV